MPSCACICHTRGRPASRCQHSCHAVLRRRSRTTCSSCHHVLRRSLRTTCSMQLPSDVTMRGCTQSVISALCPLVCGVGVSRTAPCHALCCPACRQCAPFRRWAAVVAVRTAAGLCRRGPARIKNRGQYFLPLLQMYLMQWFWQAQLGQDTSMLAWQFLLYQRTFA
jgi:hypothetical protein